MAYPGVGSAMAHSAGRPAPSKQTQVMALSTADETVPRASAPQPAQSMSKAQGGATVLSPRRRGRVLVIPGGWIPVQMLHELAATPSKAVDVAEWCKHHLLTKEEMRAWWQRNDSARAVALGEMAVQLGRLEFRLGWIQQGGLTVAGGNGWETEDGTNLSHESAGVDGQSDSSSNRGPFPTRDQAPDGQGAGMEGCDGCGMLVGHLYSELLELDDAMISFAAPASPPSATGPSAGALMSRLLGANAQVQAVLDYLTDPSMPFDATQPIRRWVAAREP